MTAKEIGKAGENTASQYLEKLGYIIIKRNYTISGGEIDIIAKDGEYLVFVEVKTRKNKMFGSGKEAVDGKKLEHMQKCAVKFIYENRANNSIKNLQPRFDGIEVYTQNGTIEHIKNIDIT